MCPSVAPHPHRVAHSFSNFYRMGNAVLAAWTPTDPDEDLFENQVKDIVQDAFDLETFNKLSGGKPFINANALYEHIQRKEAALKRKENYVEKSSAIQAIDQQNIAENIQGTIKLLESKYKEIKKARVNGIDAVSTKAARIEVRDLRDIYFQAVGIRFRYNPKDFMEHFVADYYGTLQNKERTPEDLAYYYNEETVLTINLCERFVGINEIVEAMLEKFFELDVLFSIVSVEVSDKGSGGLKKDHRADFFVVCKVDVKLISNKRSLLKVYEYCCYLLPYMSWLDTPYVSKINDDAPRRIVEFFEIKLINPEFSEKFYILSQQFVEQDYRPSYAWPERDFDGRSLRQLSIRQALAAAEAKRKKELHDQLERDGLLGGDEDGGSAEDDEDTATAGGSVGKLSAIEAHSLEDEDEGYKIEVGTGEVEQAASV